MQVKVLFLEALRGLFELVQEFFLAVGLLLAAALGDHALVDESALFEGNAVVLLHEERLIRRGCVRLFHLSEGKFFSVMNYLIKDLLSAES